MQAIEYEYLCTHTFDLIYSAFTLLHLRFLSLTALNNIELASFLRWFVAVELYDPAYAKRFYCTYEMLEENIVKVCIIKFSVSCCFCVLYSLQLARLIR